MCVWWFKSDLQQHFYGIFLMLSSLSFVSSFLVLFMLITFYRSVLVSFELFLFSEPDNSLLGFRGGNSDSCSQVSQNFPFRIICMWVRSPQAVKSDIIGLLLALSRPPSLLPEFVPVQTGKQPIFTPVYQATNPSKSHSQEFALYFDSLLSISGCPTYLLRCAL